MSAAPRIQIAVPLLNEARYLRSALDSLLAQTGVDLDIQVLDAGSTDGTLDLLARYPVNVVVEPGLGQMAAINRAWQHSDAEFVTWMAGDDRLKPGALSRLAQVLADNPAAGAVHAQAEVIDADDRVLARLAPGNIQWRDLAFEFSLVPQTALIRRTALARSGMFDEARRFAADYDLFLRLAHYYRLCYAPFVAAEYRVHPGSEDSRHLSQVGQETIRLITGFFERADLAPSQLACRRRSLAGAHLFAGTCHVLAGDRRAGWSQLAQAARVHPLATCTTRRGLGLLLRLVSPADLRPYRLRGLSSDIRSAVRPARDQRV